MQEQQCLAAARRHSLWLVLLLALVTWLAAGCGGSSSLTPVISAQPTDASVPAGSAATLSVSASGADVSYVWQQSSDAGSTWTDIVGATLASYTTPATSPADNGKRYRVTVTASGISVTSSAVQLTVTLAVVAPTLGVQAVAQTVIAPNAASFSVTASGTAPNYQWQRSTDSGTTWTDIVAATAATYDTGPTSAGMNGEQYRVVLSNSAGSATSVAALLTVSAAPTVAAISTQPTNQSVVAGNAAAFSVVATGVPTPALQWQRSTDGGTTWTNIAAAITASYSTGPTALSQDGERYRAVANNGSGSATSNAALLNVTPAPQAPAITTQPLDQSVTAPATASFTAVTSGVPTPTWQWQLSGDGGNTWANINGATATNYTTPATSVADSGKRYRVVASNASGSAASQGAVLTVAAAPVASTQRNKVAAAYRHTCAVKADASVVCWGYNSSGQIGSGNYNDYYSPNPVTLPEASVAVAAGGSSSGSSCALTVTGKLWCWGGAAANANVPTAITGYTGVRWVSVGGAHTCFISSGGGVFCWGNNSAGQLGDGTTTGSSTPVQVLGAGGIPLSGAVALAAGAMHTCAIMSNGSVMCWGNNIAGQIAQLVSGLSGVTALAAGDMAPCALLGNGTVTCWSFDGVGSTPPVAVAGLANVATLASGTQHRCAAAVDGSVRCWGTGLMGNGNVSETQPTPTLVSGLTGVGMLAAGFQHTCALRSNGSLTCWGSGSNGQLGQGDNIPRTTPTDVPVGAVFALP